MPKKAQSVLVIGFNTRPLAYSLNKVGYKVYAVDFFGDEDLFPYVEDSIIVIDELETKYKEIKEKYSHYLVEFTLNLIEKYENFDFLIIGSGLDDDYDGRDKIIKQSQGMVHLINQTESIKKARQILSIYEMMKSKGYEIPHSISSEQYMSTIMTGCLPQVQKDFILKKRQGAGGTSVYKINNTDDYVTQLKNLQISVFDPHEWIIQDFIKGIPISCTTISNGIECEIISINHQIIGDKRMNAPKEFMYCGNIIPADLSEGAIDKVSEISKLLVNELKLKGINGFDFVLRNHDQYPYLMEINPRIPGSIRASEIALGLNLLKLHIDSFDIKKWDQIEKDLKSHTSSSYATKLVYFAPEDITPEILEAINNLEFVHDKTKAIKGVLSGEPICTVLYKGSTKSESYDGALEIVDSIKKLINKKYK